MDQLSQQKMNCAIKIENLSVSYGAQIVLKDINVDFPSGKLTVVLGENGCGKSTLLNAICRLTPHNGTISVNNSISDSYSTREFAQQVSLVCQNTELLPISVYDYLLLGRTPHRPLLSISDSADDKNIVDHVVNRLRLDAYQHKALSTLSGGERQLASVGRALVQDTPIMLLDEPTANLDIRHQEEIMKILRKEVDDNYKTIIIVMHDVNLASRYADYACLIHYHNVMAFGEATDILNEKNLSTLYNTPLRQIPDTQLFFPL